MGCSIGNLKPLSKPYFHPKSLSSSSIMGAKKLSFYEKEYIGSCGLLHGQSYHP
jgi:hypothetical protein